MLNTYQSICFTLFWQIGGICRKLVYLIGCLRITPSSAICNAFYISPHSPHQSSKSTTAHIYPQNPQLPTIVYKIHISPQNPQLPTTAHNCPHLSAIVFVERGLLLSINKYSKRKERRGS